MTKTCPKCGNTHLKPGTFCSRSCANSRIFSDATNKRRSETINKNWEGKRKVVLCKTCGIVLQYNTKSVFCDDCNAVRKSNKRSKNSVKKMTPMEYTLKLISSGEIHTLNEATIRRHMKRYIISIFGHKCSICGTEEWCGDKVPLVCDHIDGDSRNSQIDNFRLVCCNCDAQLPTFKSKNRGKGRTYDRDRYHRQKEV